MEVPAASISQVRRARDGRMVLISDDVCGVAKALQEIDPNLRVRHSEAGGYFAVYEERDGRQDLVLTAKVLDHRITKRILEIRSADYDFAAEVDRMDAQAQKDKEDRVSEQIGDIGQRLAHAARKDKGIKTRVYLS